MATTLPITTDEYPFLTMPIPAAIQAYEQLTSLVEIARANLFQESLELNLVTDDYQVAQARYESSLGKKQLLEANHTALTVQKSQLHTLFSQKREVIQNNLDVIQTNLKDAINRLNTQTSLEQKNSILAEINGYYIQIQQEQDLLSIESADYQQDLEVINFQIAEVTGELQDLETNTLPEQESILNGKTQELDKANQELDVLQKALDNAQNKVQEFLSENSYLLTDNHSSQFIQDVIDQVNQKITSLQSELVSLNDQGNLSEVDVLEKQLLEQQKYLTELNQYSQIIKQQEEEFLSERAILETADGQAQASVTDALTNNTTQGYIDLSNELVTQLAGVVDIWIDNLKDNNQLTLKIWNGSQNQSESFDSLTLYIQQNLADPHGEYYLNQLQLEEAIKIQEATNKRRDALAESVDYIEDSIALYQNQIEALDHLGKQVQHYQDLLSYENQYATLPNTDTVRPLLINELVEEIDRQSKELSDNNLHKYIQQHQDSIFATKEQQLAAIGRKLQQPSRSLYFDGVNDYINVGVKPSLEVSSNLTLEAWINPQQQIQDGGGIIVSREGEYLIAIFKDGTLGIAFANSNPGWKWLDTYYTLPIDQWTHLAVSYDKGLVKAYANGALVYIYEGSGTIGDYSTTVNQDEFRIGYRQAGYSQYFKGQIDDVRVWNVTRTQSEIQSNLNQTLTGKEQGLVGYWNFEESSGNSVIDLTDYKNNGTIIGVQRTVETPVEVKYQPSKAVFFDGVNDYINVGFKPSLEVSSNLTLEAWINPQKQLQQYGGVIVNREGEYQVAIMTDGTVGWAFANSNPGWTSTNTGYVVPTDQRISWLLEF
jgi:hypothetical protein